LKGRSEEAGCSGKKGRKEPEEWIAAGSS